MKKYDKRRVIFIAILAIISVAYCGYKSNEFDDNLMTLVSSISGAVIGGLVTFYALFSTIEFEREDRKEERRLSIMPHFKYTLKVISMASNGKRETLKDELNIGEYLDQRIRIQPKEINKYMKDNGGSISYINDYEFILEVENIGLDSAININLLKLEYYGFKNVNRRQCSALKVNDK